jgi:hypothetical protein
LKYDYKNDFVIDLDNNIFGPQVGGAKKIIEGVITKKLLC